MGPSGQISKRKMHLRVLKTQGPHEGDSENQGSRTTKQGLPGASKKVINQKEPQTEKLKNVLSSPQFFTAQHKGQPLRYRLKTFQREGLLEQ